MLPPRRDHRRRIVTNTYHSFAEEHTTTSTRISTLTSCGECNKYHMFDEYILKTNAAKTQTPSYTIRKTY